MRAKSSIEVDGEGEAIQPSENDCYDQQGLVVEG